MSPFVPLNPAAWVKAFPATATRVEWDAWWSQADGWKGPRADWRDADNKGILDHALPSPNSRFHKDAPREDPQTLFWTVDALLDGEGSDWLFRPSYNQKTALLDIVRWFSDGSWVPCRPVTESGWEERRRLFRKLMAAVPNPERHRFSMEESQKASEAYRELGSATLGVAYSLETWEIAEELEAVGQTPDGLMKCNSPMQRVGIAAWTRAVEQGWDPMGILKSPLGSHRTPQPWERNQRPTRRWEQWLGARYQTLNEHNDPLRQQVVADIRRQDPEGFRFWMAESVASRMSSAKATEEPAWTEAWNEWRSHPDWRILFGRNGAPVWLEALINHPAKAWPQLRPHLNELVDGLASLRLDPDRYLWGPLLRNAPMLKALQAMPNPGRTELLDALLEKLWTGRLSNLLFRDDMGPLQWPDSDTRRWLSRLPASAFWGKGPDQQGHPRLLGDQPRERHWRQQVVALAHIHDPLTDAFRSSWPAVALCAAAQKNTALLNRVGAAGLAVEDFRGWVKMARELLTTSRHTPHPRLSEWCHRIESVLMAHAVTRALDRTATPVLPPARPRF